jgi:transketolase
MKLHAEFAREKGMMRETYCNVLIELAKSDPKIVALDADLMSSSGMKPFKTAYPDRFFNVGVAEANMVGVAAGLSAAGFVPFAHSFACFATRRVCDQIFISAAYSRLNVKIVGTDPGVTAAYNGGTHMPLEDMAVLRAIPGIKLVEPTDAAMLQSLLPQIAADYAVYYIRLQRKNPVAVYESGAFTVGKGVVVRPGQDVTLISSGILVSEALKAAALLANDGIDARVVDMFTWKPLDLDLVAACARETGALVTCENHNVFGGLGSAVCEAVAGLHPVPVERIGSQDRFGEVGPEDYLLKLMGMDAGSIAAAAKRAIHRARP